MTLLHLNADDPLCSQIAAACDLYRLRPPLRIDSSYTTKERGPYDRSDLDTSWIRKIEDAVAEAGPDSQLEAVYSDFLSRYKLAFWHEKSERYRWSHHLSTEQLGLLVACLREIRDDLRRDQTKEEKRVVLLSRTPYVLYQRISHSWTAAYPGSALPFPDPLRYSYPERPELAALMNETPPAVWPERKRDPHAWEQQRQPSWAVLAHLITESVKVAATGYEDMQPEDKQFLETETATCLGAFRTEAASNWYMQAMPIVQYEYARVALKIQEQAGWFNSLYGPFWAVRHLHHYTAESLNHYLASVLSASHSVLSDPFPDSECTFTHQTDRAVTAASLAPGVAGSYRRNRIYRGR